MLIKNEYKPIMVKKQAEDARKKIKNNIFISDEAVHTNTSFIGSVPTPATNYNTYYIR